ncbi:MAG: 3-keto-5-aminohexanoate cleavage protein [Pseudomonadota bacterium]
MEKIIIEARVNELAPRDENPNVPFLPAEIASDAAACYRAGASIVHFHGRTAEGAPDNSPEHYLSTIRQIREACPILIHPSLGYVANDADAATRFSAVETAMADAATHVDFAPMDTGSVNVDWWDPKAKRYTTQDLIYKNSTETLLHFASRIRHHRLKPYLVSWNVSFTRQIDAFLQMGVIDEPAYVCFCLTDGIMLSGHPGTEAGLDAHLAFLPKERRFVWTVVNYKGDLFRLTEKIIRAGGHISIGTGDYPYSDMGQPTNADLIARVAEQARALGREPATVEDTRKILQLAA